VVVDEGSSKWTWGGGELFIHPSIHPVTFKEKHWGIPYQTIAVVEIERKVTFSTIDIACFLSFFLDFLFASIKKSCS